jgi:hypothetical protein
MATIDSIFLQRLGSYVEMLILPTGLEIFVQDIAGWLIELKKYGLD